MDNELKSWANEILNTAGVSTKNEKLRVEQVNNAIDEIGKYPVMIGVLFTATIRRGVDDMTKAIDELHAIWKADCDDREAVRREACDLYDKGMESSARAKWDFERELGDAAYVAGRNYRDWYGKVIHDRSEFIIKYGEERVTRWERARDLIKFIGDATPCKKELVAKTLKKLAVTISGIAKDINEKLCGYPEGCETDPKWGVGGYFNAILTRGDKRVSFKSFLAGGWNIQKLHIRVRTTLLK